MKCHFCGRHTPRGTSGRPIILTITLLIVVAMISVFAYNVRSINSLKTDISMLTGMVVKENKTEEQPDCRHETVDTIEYYEETEIVEKCSFTETEYRIDNIAAINSDIGGIDLFYDLVNLENHKAELCDSFYIVSRGQRIGMKDMGCTMFAPGEKLTRKSHLPYFSFPDDSNHKDMIEIDINFPEKCISQKKTEDKPTIVKKKFYVCSE